MIRKESYLLYYMVISVITIGLYFSILNNEYTGFDDLLLTENLWNSTSNKTVIIDAFTNNVFQSPNGSYFRPTQLISYYADYLLWKNDSPNPFPFLIGNIFWLVISVNLLFYFLTKHFLNKKESLIAIILLILSPATIQSAAWIPGRGEFLLFIFSILHLIFAWKYFDSRNFLSLTLSLLFFSLALLSKETAIILPILSIGKPIIYTTNNWRQLMTNSRSLIKRFLTFIIPCIVLTIFWWLLRSNALANSPNSVAIIPNLIKLPLRLVITISNVFLPYNLGVFGGWSIKAFLYSFLSLSTFTLVVLKYAQNYKRIIFGTLWVILFCLPTGLTSLIMLHRGFLAFPGFIIVISGMYTPPILKRHKFKALLVVCLFSTLQFNALKPAFSTPLSFWENAYQYNPKSAIAINGLAWVYQSRNDLPKAISLYRKSIKINPALPHNRVSLAHALAQSKNFDSLNLLFEEEFKLTSDSGITSYHYGGLLLQKGDTAEAIPYLRLGLQTTAYNYNAKQYYDTLSIDFD